MDHPVHNSGTPANRNYNDDGFSNSSFTSSVGDNNSTFLSDSSDVERARSRTYPKRRRSRRNRKSAPRWWEFLIMGLTQRRAGHQDLGGEPLLVIEKEFAGNGAQNGLLSPSLAAGRKASSNPKRRRKWYTYLVFTSISGLSILAILLTINLLLLLTTTLLYPSRPQQPPLNITSTPFTKDIAPIACHSHNDYWRPIPLFSALHAGCISTEADVWLSSSSGFKEGVLYVGHNRGSLTPSRTFQTLYIQPLVKMLQFANPTFSSNTTTSPMSDPQAKEVEERNGIFDTDSSQTLILLIDVKTLGPKTWPFVLRELQPLREKGWLTFVDSAGVVHERAVTVVGTGETPFNLLLASTDSNGNRDTFFDAPLDRMWTPLPTQIPDTPNTDDIDEESLPTPPLPEIDSGQGMVGVSSASNFTAQNSYYASVSYKKAVGRPWRGKVTPEQVKIIRGHVRGARERGLKVRYWGVPSWPGWMRREVWGVLLREGVDVLGVDELRFLGEF